MRTFGRSLLVGVLLTCIQAYAGDGFHVQVLGSRPQVANGASLSTTSSSNPSGSANVPAAAASGLPSGSFLNAHPNTSPAAQNRGAGASVGRSPSRGSGSSSPFRNGAGPSGIDWNGTGDLSTGAAPAPFDSKGAGQCGAGQDMWSAVDKVMNTGSPPILTQRQGYNINAPNWAKAQVEGEGINCSFGPGKTSMCTSATAAVFCEHFSNLLKNKQLKVSPGKVAAFVNSREVRAAINGNPYSMAALIDHIGGASIRGEGANIKSILSQAKIGDSLRIERANGTGHSTIFKGLSEDGSKVCYWSSNKGTLGAGVQCENLSSVTTAVVSRFPSNMEDLAHRIERLDGSMRNLTLDQANRMGPSSVKWASRLECTTGPSMNLAKAGPAPAVAEQGAGMK